MFVEVLAIGAAATAGRAAWRRWNRRRAARKVLPPEPPKGQSLATRPPPRRWTRDRVELAAVGGALVSAGVAKAGTMGLLSTTGRALAGPLAVASVPLLIIGSRTMAGDAWAALRKRRRLEFVHLDMGLTVVGLLNGSLVVAAVGSTIYQLWHAVGTAQARSAEAQQVTRVVPHEEAWLDVGGTGVAVLAAHLDPGDAVVLRAGDVVPADVRLRGGQGRVDLRAPTGRLMLEEVGAGRAVPSGAVVIDGRLSGVVERPHHRSTATTLRDAGRAREFELEPIALRGKRVADASVSFSVLSAALAGLLHGYHSALGAFAGNVFAAYRLTAPVGLKAHIDHQRDQGLRVTDGRAFEQLAGLDVLIFDHAVLGERDRSGRQRLSVAEVWWPNEGQTPHPLALAAAVLAHAEDPMRAAVYEGLRQRGREPIDGGQTTRRGAVYRTVEGTEPALVMGPPGALAGYGYDDGALARWAQRMRARGREALGVVCGDAVVGGVAFAPAVRPEWAEVMRALAARGVEALIVGADPEPAVAEAARAVGVGRFVGEMAPEDKLSLVEGMQAAGHLVGYLGAELADRPAMVRADVCLLPHEADRALHDAAGVIIGAAPLTAVIHLIDAARAHHRGQGRALALSGVLTLTAGASTVLFGAGLLPVVAMQGVTIAANLALTAPRTPQAMSPPAEWVEAHADAPSTAPLTPQPA